MKIYRFFTLRAHEIAYELIHATLGIEISEQTYISTKIKQFVCLVNATQRENNANVKIKRKRKLRTLRNNVKLRKRKTDN